MHERFLSLNPIEKNSDGPPGEDAAKPFGFPQASRLKMKREFDTVFQNGCKGVSRALVIYVLRNSSSRNRLGLVVGKKVGNAVRRNRVKRMIREAFRLENPSLPAGFDIVCIPRIGGFPEKTPQLIPLFCKTFLRALRRLEERKDRA